MEINVVDTIDPGLVRVMMNLQALNQEVIEMSAGENGVARMVSAVITKVGKPGTLTVMRIHSHGNSGVINVAGGRYNEEDTLSAISFSNLPKIEVSLRLLTPYFDRQGRVELVGCEVVVDDKGRVTENSNGARLLRRLAAIWNVKVLASGNPKGLPLGSVRFIGMVIQASPGGQLGCTEAPEVTKINR